MLCNGDMLVSYPSINSASTVTVNAYGSPDLGAYPHMQLLVAGKVIGQWDVTGTAQNYSVTLPPFPLVAYRSDYYPFGEYNASGNNTDIKFTGYERDPETASSPGGPNGLDNAGARYYSSPLGRFMSPDPANAGADPTNPQSWNMYSYVLNNPLSAIDPTGLNCVWDDGSYDAENDTWDGDTDQGRKNCVAAGGTWDAQVTGDWNPSANADLSALVSDIQSLTPSAIAHAGPWDRTDFDLYGAMWIAGKLPQNIYYGQTDSSTVAMMNTPFMQERLAAYQQAGCPASFDASQSSFDAYGESVAGKSGTA